MRWVCYWLWALACCIVVRASQLCLSRYLTRPINGYHCHQCLHVCRQHRISAMRSWVCHQLKLVGHYHITIQDNYVFWRRHRVWQPTETITSPWWYWEVHPSHPVQHGCLLIWHMGHSMVPATGYTVRNSRWYYGSCGSTNHSWRIAKRKVLVLKI